MGLETRGGVIVPVRSGLSFGLLAEILGGFTLGALGGERPAEPEPGLWQQFPRCDAEVARGANDEIPVGQRAYCASGDEVAPDGDAFAEASGADASPAAA